MQPSGAQRTAKAPQARPSTAPLSPRGTAEAKRALALAARGDASREAELRTAYSALPAMAPPNPDTAAATQRPSTPGAEAARRLARLRLAVGVASAACRSGALWLGEAPPAERSSGCWWGSCSAGSQCLGWGGPVRRRDETCSSGPSRAAWRVHVPMRMRPLASRRARGQPRWVHSLCSAAHGRLRGAGFPGLVFLRGSSPGVLRTERRTSDQHTGCGFARSRS